MKLMFEFELRISSLTTNCFFVSISVTTVSTAVNVHTEVKMYTQHSMNHALMLNVSNPLKMCNGDSAPIFTSSYAPVNFFKASGLFVCFALKQSP